MLTHATCTHCGKSFAAASDAALTCSAVCRNRRSRATRAVQRRRLASEAELALASGDVDGLRRVARSAVTLLAA